MMTTMKVLTISDRLPTQSLASWIATATLATILALTACGGDSGGGSADAGATEDAESTDATPETRGTVFFDTQLLPEGVTPDMFAEGMELFEGGGICYTCHTVEGTGGPLAPDLTDDVWINVDGEYESIVELVKTGVAQPKEHPGAMLPRAGMPLTDEQVNAVSAYTYMLRWSEVN